MTHEMIPPTPPDPPATETTPPLQPGGSFVDGQPAAPVKEQDS